MTEPRHRELAAQLWCLAEHSAKQMDAEFAESIAALLARVESEAVTKAVADMPYETSMELAARTRELDAQVAALETQLSAWHSVFGTTQLDHAAERLRVAKAAVAWREEPVPRHDPEVLTEREFALMAAVDGLELEECDRCDGVGWYEGGRALQTECEKCKGNGIVTKAP